MDRILDGAISGPLFLQRAEIAELMQNALLDGERRWHRDQLHAFVVMPNHVHVLVTANGYCQAVVRTAERIYQSLR
jgi:REP element-mobilizing transposase RayT